MTTDFQKAYEQLLSLTNLQLKQYTDSKQELHRSMKRTRAFLNALGAPDKNLKIIHVTGTSGKGSVVNMLHEILLANGRSVATYTSPHTTSFLERFRLNDKLIDPNKLAGYIAKVLKTYEKFLQDNSDLSFFELSTCIALYAFEKSSAQWCVLEVGCGGRFDATNVIGTPEIAIITNIDKDHTEILGSSLSQIAYEKAGIIKKDGTVLCGEMRSSLKKIFTDEAIKKSAALFFVPPPLKNIVDNNRGAHQQHNAALARRAALELEIDEKTIDLALKNVRNLPCRFETMQQNPLVILDGAHSPAKIKALVPMITSLGRPVRLLFGCTATKDVKEMLDIISPIAKSITTARFSTTFRKAFNPAILLKMVPKRKQAGYFLQAQDAFNHVKQLIEKDEIIIVTGSLFLTGELRENWVSEEDILNNRSSFND
ncbi:MAG: Mur ligase family protein [Patescibacteria group bacterium]